MIPREPPTLQTGAHVPARPPRTWAGGVFVCWSGWPGGAVVGRRGGRAPLRASWPHGSRAASSPPPSTACGFIWCACAAPASPVGGGGVRLGVAAGRQWRRRGRQPRWPAGPRGGSCRVGVCKTRCELAARTSRATSPVAPLACRCPGAGRLDCIPIFLASGYGARVECGGPRVVDRRRCGWRSVKYKYLPNIS